jgi:hypothetical protein
VLVLTSIGSWELYLRSKGLHVDYDEGDALWANKRAMVYEPADKATVFIGASRNKYDIDIDTWQNSTGDKVVQLAIAGTSPLPVLDDLANDKNFKGKLIIDVTEDAIFTNAPENLAEPSSHVDYYKNRTPAQRFSFWVNYMLESHFVFLNKNHFSLNALFDQLPVKKRVGVFALPFRFPLEFHKITFGRQAIMTPKFLKDSTLINQVTGNWNFFMKTKKELPPTGKKLDSLFTSLKSNCDKIKARGGQIIFVRTPSSGPGRITEKIEFPREKYWDRLLFFTKCEGIHFEDYPAIAHFECPEWSHLSQPQAIVFTKKLIEILQKEKSWTFPNKQTSL